MFSSSFIELMLQLNSCRVLIFKFLESLALRLLSEVNIEGQLRVRLSPSGCVNIKISNSGFRRDCKVHVSNKDLYIF